MKIDWDLTKEYELALKSEELNLIIQAIKNRFEDAISYYILKVEQYPELKDIVKIKEK